MKPTNTVAKSLNSVSTLAVVAGAMALNGVALGQVGQCDLSTPGNFIDDRFDSGADCSDTGGVDENGGWDRTRPFIEAGSGLMPGASFRVQGVVGMFNSACDGGVATTRDLDWVRFSVAEPCYITVVLSMADNTGAALNGTDAYDQLFIKQGSDSATAVSLYGEYGIEGCPHTAKYTFPNGTQQARFPVDSGDILVVVTTPPFNEWRNDNSIYQGPMPYALDVSVISYSNESCVTASNDCITTSESGGCSDSPCCDLVCGFSPSCCDSAWDANCVRDGVDQCGNFIYACVDPMVGAANDCVGNAQLVLGFPAFISFDCIDANTDGPNEVARLCSSDTSHDLWYIVGPTPSDGELSINMCGLDNTGDAVVSYFDLGTSSDVGNPQDLPSKYMACRDDTCDDNGDGLIDTHGPASINLIGVPANHFLLIRVGSYRNPTNPNAPGFLGSMQISFRALFVNHGRQKQILIDGQKSNTGFTSGSVSSVNPKRWSLVPFEMPIAGALDGFDFVAFDVDVGGGTPDQVNFKVFARTIGDASYGASGRPFGDGNYVPDQVIASGTVPLDMNAYSDVGDDLPRRYFIDLSIPFSLDPGSYYFTCYGSKSDGSAPTGFAWAAYGSMGISQQTLGSVTIPSWDAAGASSTGTFPAGTPFLWRGIGAGPKFCFYTLGSRYSVQQGDNPGLLYNLPFNLKGKLDTSCYGDFDGSGEVDSGDMGVMLLDCGPCRGCSTDLDGSGEVDTGDVGLELLNFGPCN
jgi:hypothetical protein